MDFPVTFSDRILVTGSNGFIGTSVVENLLARGFVNLRLLVRPSSNLDKLKDILKRFLAAEKVELVVGDLVSPTACQAAARDVAVIIHLAAGFDKTMAGVFQNSVLATRNLVDAFVTLGQPKRFVQVSSFAVYSNLNLRRGALLDETSPLEDAPEKRHDAYAFGKLKQEETVQAYGHTHHLPFVILRPGTVFGPGKRDLTGRIGIRVAGLFFRVGGSNPLPLTYVGNCAEAIVAATIKPGIDGQIFNVVDDERMTSRQFLRAYSRRVGGFISLPVPYVVAYFLCAVCEFLAGYIKILPRAYNRRRCSAEWKGNQFTNRKLREQLGWQPRVPMPQAMAEFLGQFKSDAG